MNKHTIIWILFFTLLCGICLYVFINKPDPITPQPNSYDSILMANIDLLDKVEKIESEKAIFKTQIDSLQSLKTKIEWRTITKTIPMNVDTLKAYLDSCVNDVLICEQQLSLKDSLLDKTLDQYVLVLQGNESLSIGLEDCNRNIKRLTADLSKSELKCKRLTKGLIISGGIILIETLIIL